MATKNPEILALRTLATELGYPGNVKQVDLKVLRTWVKNEEACIAAEAKVQAKAQRAADETKAYEMLEATRLAALTNAAAAARRSAAAKKSARTRAARTTPSNEELFDGRRREQVRERIADAPKTALGLALKRAAA